METMEILSVLIAAENKRITGATKAIGQLRKLEESHADLLAALKAMVSAQGFDQEAAAMIQASIAIAKAEEA
jgi:hypothetical protein